MALNPLLWTGEREKNEKKSLQLHMNARVISAGLYKRHVMNVNIKYYSEIFLANRFTLEKNQR